MAQSKPNIYLQALGLGAMAGIRSMSAPALISYKAVRGNWDLKGTPFEPLTVPLVSKGLRFMSAGEMVADKLPILPDRTDFLPMLGRIITGAGAGAALFTYEKQSPLVGAVLGGLAGGISTRVSFQVRRALTEKVHLPSAVGGIVGDAVVLGIALSLKDE